MLLVQLKDVVAEFLNHVITLRDLLLKVTDMTFKNLLRRLAATTNNSTCVTCAVDDSGDTTDFYTLKMKLVKVFIWPVITYEAKGWTLKEDDERRFEAMWCCQVTKECCG